MAFLSCALWVATAYIEWRRRPPLPRLWAADEEHRLTIRSLTTGELLLQAPQGHLVAQDLRDTWLPNANLQGVDLTRADFRGAHLRGANLRGAVLAFTDLSAADLRGAELATLGIRKTAFRDADLRGANLRGGELNLAIWDPTLGGADFTGAKYNRSTRWPPGFDPQTHGCIFHDDAESTLPIPARPDQLSAANHTLPCPSAARCVEGEAAQYPLRPLR